MHHGGNYKGFTPKIETVEGHKAQLKSLFETLSANRIDREENMRENRENSLRMRFQDISSLLA